MLAIVSMKKIALSGDLPLPIDPFCTIQLMISDAFATGNSVVMADRVREENRIE